MSLTVNDVCVYEFANHQEAFLGHGSTPQLAASPKSLEICERWIRHLWVKTPNGSTTSMYPFSVAPSAGPSVKQALADYSKGIQVVQSSDVLAKALARSAWTDRYVMVLLGFSYDTDNYVTLVLTKSASNETFAVQNGQAILDVLPNIYERKVEKGALYPVPVSFNSTVLTNQARVYQAKDQADFFPKCLGLDVKPSTNQIIGQAVSRVIDMVRETPASYTTQTEEVRTPAQTFAHHLVAVSKEIAADSNPTDGRLAIHVDGVEVTGKVDHLRSGAVRFERNGHGGYQITLSGPAVKVRIGDTWLDQDEIEALIQREGGLDDATQGPR